MSGGPPGEWAAEREGGERACLTPLPTRLFVGTHEEVRKVSWDCLVSFGGNRYSVPWPYAAQQVWLRPSRGTHLLVRDQHGEEIARHALATRKGSTVLDPAHYAGLPGARGGRSDQPRTKALLAHVFLRRFPDHGAFVDGLVAQQYNNAGKHLRVVLALAEVYSTEAMQAALTAAQEYQTYSHRFIRGVLEAGDVTRQVGSMGGPGTLGSVPALPALPALRPAIPVLRVAVDLGVYQRVLEAEQ